jgi:hypothetical protein
VAGTRLYIRNGQTRIDSIFILLSGLFGLFGLVANIRWVFAVGYLRPGFLGFTAGILQAGVRIGAKAKAVLFALKPENKNPSFGAVGLHQQR